MKRFLVIMSALSLIPSVSQAQPRHAPSTAASHFSFSRSASPRFSGGSRSFSSGFGSGMSGSSLRPMMGGRGMGGRGIAGGTGPGKFSSTPAGGGTTTTTPVPNANQTPPPWATVGNYTFSPGMIVKTDPKGANEVRINNDAGGVHYDDTGRPQDFDQARGPFTDPVLSGYANAGGGSSSGSLFGNLGH